MQTYAPPTNKARAVSALVAVLASTTVVGGQLGLFSKVSHDADVELAKAASPASGALAERDLRPARRPV